MTTTITNVCEALATAVSTLVPCSPFPVAAINAPCAQVASQPYDPRMVMSKAKASYEFVIGVFLTAAADDAAQRKLAGFREPAGTGSIIAAIEGNTALAALVDYASVINVGPPAWVEIAGSTYASVMFTVEVVW